jgi:hypothetical protein
MSRIAACAVLFVASALLVGQRAGPVAAQEKKTANLEKQIAVLKQELQQAAQQNNALKNANSKLQAEVNRLQGIVKKDAKDDKKDAKTMKGLQAAIDGYRGAGLVHVVVLTLKSGESDSEAQSLIDDTYSQLSKIKTVRGVWAGKPAAKGTPDAKSDYTVALVFVFDDADGLKTYLNDSAHTKFADKHLKKWEAPAVYDFEPKKPAP